MSRPIRREARCCAMSLRYYSWRFGVISRLGFGLIMLSLIRTLSLPLLTLPLTFMDHRETNKYELSSFEKRAAYATGLGAVGLLVASAFLYFPSRRILTLTVTPNARQVQLQTPRMLPFLTPRVRTYNIQDLYLQEPLWTGVGRNECEVKGTAGMGFAVLWVSRRVGARFQGFLLDREGSFWEADGGAKLVDKLFIANK
ncbi:hypothetical protein SAICODRAFT_167994 [Saitoella complicata NRRL Y-17804]|uniref:uncharacterized protein n=1 Tax=Saitoella complicata (strain BCRC 22490 / CBS 7301 / JCM 7358 / NBRC 10748 / NRRL Y-17804) TaxID=698492 RepID=UPI00086709DB|nr:uncharacterized protein SAICODRAFT_167994 [Saitoella complicata NRRL Y-17804]ODQ50716.1 hypothetical protein SAICODRAFT_167994 [Saitoella complicata NRRL Y-17804]